MQEMDDGLAPYQARFTEPWERPVHTIGACTVNVPPHGLAAGSGELGVTGSSVVGMAPWAT